ncbi:MAG: HAMP domain-containing protein [Burkholderiaceae bacterium]|nr:HAMP domain-containing protein [Burkholderiaceae bacterium]
MNALLLLLRRFSVRTRLIGATAGMLTLLTLVSLGGWFGLSFTLDAQKRMSGYEFKLMDLAGTMRHGLVALRRHEKDLMLAYGYEDRTAAARAAWQAERQRVTGALDEISAMVKTDDGQKLIAGIRTPMTAYLDNASRVLDELHSGSIIASLQEINDRLAKEAGGEFTAAEQAMETGVAKVRETLAASQAKVDGFVATVQAALLAAIVVAVTIGVVAAIVIVRSIAQPLAAGQRFAQALADGDLTARPDLQGHDEVTGLMQALGAMSQRLQGVVGDVRSGADAILTASTEVAAGNQDLSARTEQTASHLQQTASAMEQLASSSQQANASAAQADQLARGAADVARRGGEVVTQVVTTMEEISSSSRRIGDIIGTIDGIAFQTNILALNAAVEAARAGEQGRGFAVVAGEVRTLAQRSAEAAREIKALIGSSVDRVEAGSRLVGAAGSTMAEIVASVQRVSDIIGEISSASGEQTQGMGQVGGAVTELDRATQQNAALVEEGAAAATSLRDQARRLTEVVSVFRTDDSRHLHA